MIAFAANSLLCREALASGHIDAASFTLVRIISGAIMLGLFWLCKYRSHSLGGNWLSALALLIYAAGFSFAYLNLGAGTGALLLFGAVQATMIIYGLWQGERLRLRQTIGVIIAALGLIALLLPGVTAPPLLDASLMVIAGCAWGVYSLLGRGSQHATLATAGNFIRAIPLTVILFLILDNVKHTSSIGISYAVASGALASGAGYALWYAVLPALAATTAATVQLSVPIIAAFAGIFWLNEAITLRFTLASVAVLGGIALFIVNRKPR